MQIRSVILWILVHHGKLRLPGERKEKDSISSIASWCEVSMVCYARLHNTPVPILLKGIFSTSTLKHSMANTNVTAKLFSVYPQRNTNQSFIYLWLLKIHAVLHHAFLKYQCLHSVVYQSLHWLMLCYYMKLTWNYCYTLPLCRLDFSNDSDECPELNADPITNQCLVWLKNATVHLHMKDI